MYDPRVGRFLSVDPIARQYPELTPYQYASDRPIDGVDRDGNEWWNPLDLHNGPIGFDADVASYLFDLIFIKPFRTFSEGATNVMQGDVQKTLAQTGTSDNQNNSHITDDVKKQNADENIKEGTAKMVLGLGQMVQSSADISTTYTPVFMEGLLGEGTERATLGIIGSFGENTSIPIKAPYTPEVAEASGGSFFRGDTRAPEDIFKSGFESRGTNTDVVDYVENNTPSIYVGTSKDASEAAQKANTKGYVYVIGNNGKGYDVNNYYKALEGRENPHSTEQEVIFENKIPSSQIEGAYPVINGKIDMKGFIKNPAYQAPQKTGP